MDQFQAEYEARVELFGQEEADRWVRSRPRRPWYTFFLERWKSLTEGYSAFRQGVLEGLVQPLPTYSGAYCDRPQIPSKIEGRIAKCLVYEVTARALHIRGEDARVDIHRTANNLSTQVFIRGNRGTYQKEIPDADRPHGRDALIALVCEMVEGYESLNPPQVVQKVCPI